MTITEKQAADRMKGIGSSDAAAVMGLSPWMSKHDLWMVKTGRADGFKGNEATRRGDMLEQAIRDMMAVELGERVVACPGPFVNGILRANLDGQVGKYGKGNPVVECKSSMVRTGWGQPGTNAVPAHVMIQVTHQMHCAEASIAHVGRLDYNMWPEIYTVEYDPDLARMIEELCERFWIEHVQADTPPEITNPSKDTLDALLNIERRKGSTVAIDPMIAERYVMAKEKVDAAEAELKVAKANLANAVGDHENFTAQGFKCNLAHVSGRKSLDTKAIQKELPDVWEKYQKIGSGHHRITIKRVEDDHED